MRRIWLAILAALAVTVVALPATALARTAGRAVSVQAGSVQAASAQAGRAAPAAVRLGARGQSVSDLQRRLAALKYYPGPANGVYGTDTEEAVWAFEETQGLPGTDYAGGAVWRALAHPRAPRVLVPNGGGSRIEINLSAEVLVLYRNNQPELISHVSTGGGYYYCSPGGGCGTAITPVGNFRTLSYYPGWMRVPLGYMFNPVFFIGTAFAIHGDIPVPLQPVSHGCVRIPMGVAGFFHTLIKIPGTPVYIRR